MCVCFHACMFPGLWFTVGTCRTWVHAGRDPRANLRANYRISFPLQLLSTVSLFYSMQAFIVSMGERSTAVIRALLWQGVYQGDSQDGALRAGTHTKWQYTVEVAFMFYRRQNATNSLQCKCFSWWIVNILLRKHDLTKLSNAHQQHVTPYIHSHNHTCVLNVHCKSHHMYRMWNESHAVKQSS